MSTVAEIIDAVKLLNEAEKDEFLDRLREIEFEDSWDRQLEADAKAGKLDFLVREADEAVLSETLRDWRRGRENILAVPRRVDSPYRRVHPASMSTLAEIEEVLPKLKPEELMHVEATLHRLQRERGVGVIFDDAYGVWTEEDQASVAAEAWCVMEDQPPRA
ncbi:MAG: hypothetical protein ABMA13_01960 [Chthoniobacteraceae bacterium]